MEKYRVPITILGILAIILIGILCILIVERPLPRASTARGEPVGAELRRSELERGRLARESMRVRARIRGNLAGIEASLRRDSERPSNPQVHERLADGMLAVADEFKEEAGSEPELESEAQGHEIESDIPPPALHNFVPDTVAYEEFSGPLEPYGAWFETADYGAIWQPDPVYVDAGWAPYTNGSWAYSSYGWSWESRDPFGWASDHYGRWLNISRHGWVWVPGREWAPAWVSWRSCETHIGWAPLPPSATWNRGVGIGGWVDAHCDIGPGHYNFVDHQNFGARDCRSLIIDRSRNGKLIGRTTNITRLHYDKHSVINRGPSYASAVERSAHPIRRHQTDVAAEARNTRRRIAAEHKHKGKQPRRGLDLKQPTRAKRERGWENVGSRQDELRLRRQLVTEARGALLEEERATRRPQRGMTLTAISKRSPKMASSPKIPSRAPAKANVVQEGKLPSSGTRGATPERGGGLPDHFAAEQARRDQIHSAQTAAAAQRQRLADQRQVSVSKAQQRLDDHIRSGRVPVAAKERDMSARKDQNRSRVASVDRSQASHAPPSRSDSQQSRAPRVASSSRPASRSNGGAQRRTQPEAHKQAQQRPQPQAQKQASNQPRRSQSSSRNSTVGAQPSQRSSRRPPPKSSSSSQRQRKQAQVPQRPAPQARPQPKSQEKRHEPRPKARPETRSRSQPSRSPSQGDRESSKQRGRR